VRRALVLALAVACRSSDQAPPSPPPGPAVAVAPPAANPEQLVTLGCTSCHGADILAQQQLTEKQWAGVVKKMAGWGALVEDKDQHAVAALLAAKFGAGATPAPRPVASGDALAAIEPTEDGALAGGDAARGKVLYVQACAACHAEDARGNAIGVNLVDRYLLYRAADFAAYVRVGRGRMPPAPLPDAQLADLLAWLRTLRAES
jgi:mono/diheme cytochrome c family protein